MKIWRGLALVVASGLALTGCASAVPRADSGKLSVEVSQVFDLADTANAYRALEGGHVRGKVIVRI